MVAIWVDAGGEPSGLVIDAAAAIASGLTMIGIGGRLCGGGPVYSRRAAIAAETPADMSEDMAARLVIDFDDAVLAIDLSAIELTELAAALGALAREIG
jgi:hypothetical protein